MKTTAPTISVIDYLESENGKKALRLFKKHVSDLGKGTAKKNGWGYCLANELFCALSERLPSSVYNDFDLKAEIMNADPKDVEKEWEVWEFSDYAGNILGSNDDEYNCETKAAFGDWLAEDEKDW